MHRFALAWKLGLAFTAGCVLAQVAPALVVPPVRAGASPTRWEYQCIHVNAGRDQAQVQLQSNQLGAQGWEMVGGAGVGNEYMQLESWCFKRALP